jgi:hypothetical protein
MRRIDHKIKDKWYPDGAKYPVGCDITGTCTDVAGGGYVLFEEDDVEIGLGTENKYRTRQPEDLPPHLQERYAVLSLVLDNQENDGVYLPGIGVKFPILMIIHGGE